MAVQSKSVQTAQQGASLEALVSAYNQLVLDYNRNVGLNKLDAEALMFNRLNIVSKTAAYTATMNDGVILGNATSAAFTITLPLAATAYDAQTDTGFYLVIKKTDASANAVTIKGNGSETIDGTNTKALATQYATYQVVSDGTAWHII